MNDLPHWHRKLQREPWTRVACHRALRVAVRCAREWRLDTSAIASIRRVAFASRLLPAARLSPAAVSSVLVTCTAADIPSLLLPRSQ